MRVTGRQKLFVRIARWLRIGPYDVESIEARQWRKYERDLVRWHRENHAWPAAPKPKPPLPVLPAPPIWSHQ